MKRIFISILTALLTTFGVAAQTVKSDVDTNKVYSVVETMPRFPGCDNYGTPSENDSCTQVYLLDYIYRVIRYPEEAQKKNIEGQAVVRFIVERNGTVSGIEVMKDPGGGLGDEAKNAIASLNEVGFFWTPGKQKGTPVRCYMTLPVRFKLEEEPAFVTNEKGDTIYTRFDTPVEYSGGEKALEDYVVKQLKYPATLKDCASGVIQATLMVRSNGEVEVLDMYNFSGLNDDATYEAIRVALSTKGKWKPAVFKEKKVNSSYPLRIAFMSPDPACKTANSAFNKAALLAEEAQALASKNESDKAIAKLNEAIGLDAKNMEYYYLRGTLYMNQNKKEEACLDFTKVKETLLVNWVDNILPLLCGKKEEGEK